MLEVSCDGIFSPVFTPTCSMLRSAHQSGDEGQRDLIAHCADLGFCKVRWGEGPLGRTDQGGGDQEIFPCLFTFNSKGKRQEFHLVLQEVRKVNF